MGFALLLLSSTEGWGLPPCPGSPTSSWSTARNWTECFGTRTHSSGGKYDGEWKDGKEHGQGTFTFADGRVEEGIWEFGELESAKKPSPTVTAKKTPSNGSSLPPCPDSPTSSWSTARNWTDCFGTRTHSSGGKYVGEWKNGKEHGQGTFTFGNGTKYVGEYKDGKRNGQGTLYNADGTVFEEGIWKNNEFLYFKKLSPTVTAKKSSLEKVEEQCAEIGFTKGTEKFGDCVMKLLN